MPPGETAPVPEGRGLLAAYNLMERFHADPDRVFVGGFSGGSRIAMRLALGYPDLFHGVLLNAGGDPLGNAEAGAPPLPPRDLQLADPATRIHKENGAAGMPPRQVHRFCQLMVGCR